MNLTELKEYYKTFKEKIRLEKIADKLFTKSTGKKTLKQNILLNISLMIRHFVVAHKNLVLMIMLGFIALIIFFFIYLNTIEKKTGEANKWFEISLSYYRKAFIDKEMTPEQRMQSLKQSIGRFQDVINRFGNTPLKYDALMYQGNAYFELGDYNSALQKYQELIDKKSRYYFADFILINIGKCYEQINNLQGALDAYQTVIDDYKKKSGVAESKFNKAKIKELTNKVQEAFQIYRNILQEHPRSVWSQEARRRILFIQALAAQQQPKKPQTQPKPQAQPGQTQSEPTQPGAIELDLNK